MKQTCSQILWEEFSDRKRRNPAYSQSAFAKTLGISPASLSQILLLKRRLAKKVAEQILKSSVLEKARQQSFVESFYQDIFHDKNISEPLKLEPEQELSLDQFKIISNWYHYAILGLASFPKNKWCAKWISKKLRIKEHEANGAMKRLLRLQLVATRGRGFYQCTPPLSTVTQYFDEALKNYHSQNLDRAKAELALPQCRLELFGTMTIAADESKLNDARTYLREARRKLASILETKTPTRVYTLCTQLIPISESVQDS